MSIGIIANKPTLLIGGSSGSGAYVTGATSVGNNSTTVLTFTSTYDNGSYFGSNRFTIAQTGLYLVNGYVHWPSNSTGVRVLELRLNGTDYINGQSDNAAVTVDDVRQQMVALIYLTATNYLELTVFQTSGGSLTPSRQTFSIARIS